jgi:hypothetical protein
MPLVKRFFFAEKTGPEAQTADANWTVVGHLGNDGIKTLRKAPEHYVFKRTRQRRWEITDATYSAPTDDNWQRKTVDIDSPGNQAQ